MGNVWDTGMQSRAYPPLSAAPAGSEFAASGAGASCGLCRCEETLQTQPWHKERHGDPRGISPLQRCGSRRSGKMYPEKGIAAHAHGSNTWLSSSVDRDGGCGSRDTAHSRGTQKCPEHPGGPGHPSVPEHPGSPGHSSDPVHLGGPAHSSIPMQPSSLGHLGGFVVLVALGTPSSRTGIA